ncbi:MAG: 16S rRNA (cytidine(1402)-2'-O)-methyltransferase [Deltaproteobacteria bacterium]|nr:16S rRNA (cytidine(1402)-2'-O)-methyltransferase [Deltaproteobacteria bacterium]
MPLNLPTHDSMPGETTGVLYIVATPIGNRDDITLRALKTLGLVDIIAAEDTRHTARFLNYHGIRGNLISCHEHNEQERASFLVYRLKQGMSVALVSSAGTPSVSDPGYRLVVEAVKNNVRVVPIPGPSAAVTALCAAGLATDSFIFEGFAAKKKTKRRRRLEQLAHESSTVIFYESPRRILTLVKELIEIAGDRNAVLGREMTKLHEEFIRGNLSDILKCLTDRPAVKGECTLLVDGYPGKKEPLSRDFEQELRDGLINGNDRLSILSKRIAAKYGITRNMVYEEGLKIKSEIDG